MYNLLFELIMSNNCNKKCSYCKLDFKNNSISKETLDNFSSLLNESRSDISSCIINFFGGEPLLNFQHIEYFIKSNNNLDFIKYSIGTNGILLSEDMLDFFIENNFKIHLSIDEDNILDLLSRSYLKKGFNNIEINYIIEPDKLANTSQIFRSIVDFGFNKINIMPVYFTKNRNLKTLGIFKKFIDNDLHLINRDKIKINFFPYFNGETSDIQYIIDTDSHVYSDIDSLLWIQKQGGILEKNLVENIDKITNLGDIKNLNLKELIFLYNSNKIINMIKYIPIKQGFVKTYSILNKIMNG